MWRCGGTLHIFYISTFFTPSYPLFPKMRAIENDRILPPQTATICSKTIHSKDLSVISTATLPQLPQPYRNSQIMWLGRRAALINRSQAGSGSMTTNRLRLALRSQPSRQSCEANAWQGHLVSADHSMPEVSWATP